MAYAGLLDGGLRVYAGCASDWTGGTDISSIAHGIEFETTVNGIGGGSFWFEVASPFDVSSYSWAMHGKRVNVWHVSDAVTSYLYKGYIVNDPRRGAAGETSRVTVELGGPLDVAKWRTDCAFTFTDADTQECWIINKRNNQVFNCETGNSIRIAVDKGDKVPDNYRAGVIGYVPYLGAQYMIGSTGNRFEGVKRIDGHISFVLGDGMRARLMGRAAGYTDERDVTKTGTWTMIKEWVASDMPANNKYFDSNSWGHSWPANGYKYLALALYSVPVTGSTNVMSADRFVELDECRVYTGTTAKRIDEGMVTIANWVNLHNTTSTGNIYSVVPSLAFRPYGSPVDALNEFSLQADKLVQWGWWPSRSTNGIQFRATYLPTSGIRSQSYCYTVDAQQHSTSWDVSTHPEDGQGDTRAVRLIYGRVGRKTDWPAGTPNAVIGRDLDEGVSDPGFRNTGGPFQGSTSIVTTVDFSARNFPEAQAKKVAARIGRALMQADKMGGTTSSRALTLTRTVDSTPFPWAYVQAGEFIVCSQEDASSKPLLISRCHVDVDSNTVEMDIGLPSDALIRQLEQAGRISRLSGWAKRRR